MSNHITRTALILAALLLLFCRLAPAQEIKPCKPKRGQERQHRGDVKHRPIPGPVRARPLTVENMFSWRPPADVDDPKVRHSMAVIDQLEDRVFRLEALVWLIKVSSDDCDIHIELSGLSDGEKGYRVIAEIPKTGSTSRRGGRC